MIKNIILDIGRVILRFDQDELIDNFYQGDEESRNLLKTEIFKNWFVTDTGTVPDDEFARGVIEKLPDHLKKYASKLFECWTISLEYVDGAEEFVKEMKEKGYILYVISNISNEFAKRHEHYKIFSYFDGKVFSAPIQMTKPHREIYEYLLNKYDLKAEECLFIDDTPKNIEGAKKVGIDGFVFENNYDAVREYLKSRNG